MRDRPGPELQAFLREVEAVLLEIRSSGSHPGVKEGAPAAALSGRGWCAPQWPTRWGGGGLSPQQAFLLDRSLSEAGIPRPDPEAVNRVGQLLLALGSPAQCERWLPALLSGRETWVVHGSLLGADPLPIMIPDGHRPGASGSILAYGARSADRMLALAGNGAPEAPTVVAIGLTPGAVSRGLPLDPDRIDLDGLNLEPVGTRCPADALRTLVAEVDAGCARLGRCRSATLRRTMMSLASVPTLDDRLAALQIELLGLEAMELRAFFPSAAAARTGTPDEALLAAVSIRAGELGVRLSELAIDALGYHALPAPDPLRQHNELMTGAAPGVDAIGALLRYVGGLDTMGARNQLAHLAGVGSDEG